MAQESGQRGRLVSLTEVFSEFGRAAHQAQLIEYGLVSLWMMDSVTQGASFTQGELVAFEQVWSKKTMGQLLKPLEQSGLIPLGLKASLEQLRKERNLLMHSFFTDEGTDLQTNAGRREALKRLQRIWKLLAQGQEFVARVANSYLDGLEADATAMSRRRLEE